MFKVRTWSTISTLRTQMFCDSTLDITDWRDILDSLLWGFLNMFWRHADRQSSPHTRTQDMGSPTGVKGTLSSSQANSRSISTHWPACCNIMFSHRKSVCAKPPWCNTFNAWSIHLQIRKLVQTPFCLECNAHATISHLIALQCLDGQQICLQNPCYYMTATWRWLLVMT